jgi:sodium-dependent phosphate cotransporter
MDHSERPAVSAGVPDSGGPLAALLRVLALLALLYVFLLAITLLGTAFKTFGKSFSEALITSTTNPVIGLMIGLLATSLIQSSSGTTSIVVGLVAAGALTVPGAIPIIMGANMGTTVTNTIVALGSMGNRAEFRRAFAGATMHDFFNLLTILILFPLEQATHYLEKTATWLSSHLVGAGGVEFRGPVNAITKPVAVWIKHLVIDDWEMTKAAGGILMVVFSLACLFLALAGLTRVMKHVVMTRAEGAFSRVLNKSGPLGMLLGLVVTVSVQSSSITTSLLIPLIGAGIINLESAFTVTLGANVGTTVTALLASMTGNPAAVTVALVHFLFNVSGILILYPVPRIRRIPIQLAKGLAQATSHNRMIALYYMLGVFFILPLVFVLVSRALSRA